MVTRCTRAFALFLGLSIPACASDVVTLDSATRDSLKQAPEIKVVHYNPPDIQLQGATRMGYGASAGTAAAVASQANIQAVRELALQDPVLRVKSNVTSSVAKLLATNNLTSLPSALPDDRVENLKGFFGRDTVLDFVTTYWGVAPIPFQPNDLVLYRARARLLQFPEGKLLWQGSCDLEADDSAGMPGDKSIPVTKGLILNNTLNRLADRCAELLVSQFSGKPISN